MKTSKVVESILRPKPEAGSLDSRLNHAPDQIVAILLEEEPWCTTSLEEVSLHLPKRGKIYIAYFTGAHGGQVCKSTGQTDYAKALELARKWETEARIERALLGRPDKSSSRVRNAEAGTRIGLTQKEVAAVLGISERAVRQIEARAFAKLKRHPLLRELWREYSSDDLAEASPTLEPAEITALLGLARTPEELRVMQKVLQIVGAGVPPLPL